MAPALSARSAPRRRLLRIRMLLAALTLAALAAHGGARAQASGPSTDAAYRCRFPVATWVMASTTAIAPTLVPGETFSTVCLRHAVVGAEGPADDLQLSGSLRTVRRGDVAIVRMPGFPDAPVTPKRVVGLPGDRIRFDHGVIQLNGADMPRERLPDLLEPSAGIKVICQQYRETLPGGRSYAVISLGGPPGRPAENTPEHLVPPGHVFVVGDNRDNSMDSRMKLFGDVPFAYVIGIVTKDDDRLADLFRRLLANLSGPRLERSL